MTDPGALVRGLAVALSTSPDAVALQRDGVVVAVNPRLVALCGWPGAATAIGARLIDLLALDAGRAMRADGTRFDAEIRETTFELDGAVYAVATVRDVTEQRQAETTRRGREALYKALFEVNAAIKLLIDPVDGRIVDANPAAAQFYGWSLDELRRMRISDINTLGSDEIQTEMERARSRRRTSFQFRHRTRSGSIADVEVHSGPFEIDGRTLLLSIIHDVTERNRFEEQLRHAQRLEAIGRLAAGIAHDFNNLLTVISASVQLAERDPTAERIARCLADVRGATRSGADLTRHLFALGREQTLTPSAVDLGRMLTNLASLLQRVLGDAITVTTDLAAGLPRVQVDPGQLELVLINMALNARDAMPGGGHLVLGAFQPAAPPAGLEGADLIGITVTDDGAGMDETTRARVFEPFFTTKPVGAGSGLGLAVAFGIAAQSGGTITVESRSGQGTCFTLFLPADRESAEAVEASEPEPVPVAGTLLLVDDQREVREALRDLLTEIGFIVHTAAGASEALAVLSGLPAPVDLVLSDVAMPGRSGIELAADIAARWPDVAVVLMSGHADVDTSASGVLGFLRKPFSVDELTALLRRVAPDSLIDL